MLTITVSGPQSQRSKALKSLEDAGFNIVINGVGDPTSHDWGHTDNGPHEVFLTVEGGDVDRCVEVLEPLRWRLRSHRERVELTRELSAEDRLAAIGVTADDLRTLLGVK